MPAPSSEQVQRALFRIAELASAAQNMQEFYRAVHSVVGELMYAENFYIALYDEERQLISYPYYVDESDLDPPAPNRWDALGTGEARGTTAYVLRTGEPQLLTSARIFELIDAGEVALLGVTSAEATWLGVPLKAEGRTVGVLVVQSYTKDVQYTEQDKELLAFVGQHVGAALSRARAIEETRQRNAELALINSVQEALAGELELQAIYDVVGDKLQEVFDAQVVDIGIYDEATALLHFPYTIERGVRFPDEPIELIGFRRHVIETRETLLLDEDVAGAAERYGNPVLQGEMPKSVLYVPLVAGGKATGVISLQNIDREHAFAASDQQLLETLAQSLSVALENARLVHETRQRNAELALINTVQSAVAGQLDPQAIYEIVGEKVAEVYDAQAVSISAYDEASGLLSFPYLVERGERFAVEPMPVVGFRKHVLETGQPLLVNENVTEAAERYGNPMSLVGEVPKSVLFVPLFTGGRPSGVISLQNVDREHAFSDSDQRLLMTLAGGISAALENARLVQETQQRNAELALINSVQAAIAGELDAQAIYDLVGDRIQEVFDAQVVDIGIYDEPSGLIHFPYAIERGIRFPDEPIPLIGFRKHVMETREPLMVPEVTPEESERYGNPYVLTGEPAKSDLFVPLIVSGRATGVISLQNLDRTHAFSDADQRLLTTLAGSLSVALENARLVHETRQRNAELALINSVQAAIAGELDPQAIYDLVGDKLQEVFDAQVVSISVYDEQAEVLTFPYVIERGERLEEAPIPLIGFRKHVMETREPLMIEDSVPEVAERYGNPYVLSGEPIKSALFVPLLVGGRATGVVSLQNVDRTHAFTQADERLLTTLAGSLSVALDNARLVHETRQRVAELATVNRVGQALASQLELDALIELVGERVRETFGADIAYVALHDAAAGRIDFVYYHEAGERRQEPPLRYGEGLTSQILESREPLLLNRAEQYEGRAGVGTPSRSYLGVPILVGELAIGVISVQSIHEEGRFGEAETGLLATIAANVGVAIQNARTHAEIRRQKQFFESLVGVSPVAVVVMDADERVTGWNPAAAELFGYSADEALGHTIDDLVFHQGHREEGRELTREALEYGRAQRIAQRERKDGTLVDVELMLVPLHFDGEHVGFYAIYHDITELQRAREEAEAATQAKSAFLATMSHEIRTPMNAVIGMTGLLLDTDLTPEQREFAEVVRSSGDALLHVIDDILDYSKIEAGKLELEKEPVDIRECIEGALEIVAPRAWEKEIELGLLVDEGAPAGIVGDAARLRQVLLNLLSNAVKFTEQGEVVVTVDAEPAQKNACRLHVAVRDTGIGIPEDRMGRLFTSFSQVDTSTTRRYGGTGLGLAISKRLVELMGGAMWVESTEGEGSTFHIELTAKEAKVPARIEEGDAPQLEGKRVLVVDDNATNREIVTRHARAWRMEPVAIASPVEALASIERGEKFDVAVLDMMMPEMDGLTLAHAIRKHRDARELPLVLLTSLGRLPQAQSSGAFEVQLAKPVRASQLYNALVKALAEHLPEPEPGEPVAEAKPAASPLRILLAEDNAVNQKVALRLLDRLGYRADVAWNGVEALEALERQRYDVVLMDVQMPELDGLDASRRICDRWPPETRPRIIAMTANALPEDREACFAAGMDDYVAKPIRPDELAEALDRARPVTGAPADGRLDEGALSTLRDLGGDEFLTEVIDAFLADAPNLLATLRRSLDDHGTDELRRAAHTLKSNGATLGAGEFTELCRELEQRAREGRLDGAAGVVARIEQEYETLENALAALRPGVPR
ncbi:MAG TPA: GAF domain-containing protein [Gaiellaceae bacterium]|nr:GAF domain-containing protein [Gaiellaceae bacterium]